MMSISILLLPLKDLPLAFLQGRSNGDELRELLFIQQSFSLISEGQLCQVESFWLTVFSFQYFKYTI